MEIYLLRHGIAEPAQAGQPDADRALTPEGKRKLREVLRVAKSSGVKPTLILTSPYRRALETAEVAGQALGYRGELLQTKALAPGSNVKEVWEELRVHRNEGQLLLSGHEPQFSQLFAYLLASPALQVDFKKGALARVDVEQFGSEPRGVLRWMMPSKLAAAAD